MTTRSMQVDSSHMKGFEYDEEAEKLTVTFKSGKVYEYAEVPSGVVDFLMETAEAGESVGRAFSQTVKGQYEYRTVEA